MVGLYGFPGVVVVLKFFEVVPEKLGFPNIWVRGLQLFIKWSSACAARKSDACSTLCLCVGEYEIAW